MKRVGIIGAGLIGGKRAAQMKGAQLVAVCDPNSERATTLADAHGAHVETSAEELVKRPDVDIVIVSTINDALVPCGTMAVKAGKHVLIEKPAARSSDEIQTLIEAMAHSSSVVRVGFNHRFHPAFQKAKHLLSTPSVGPLMYIRARYGHGGRVGYDREWRADPQRSGGGELLDQGVHLIDLCRWLGGEFQLQWGMAKTFFWDMPVEDNGFMMLRSPDGQRSAFLHASCTEWKNLFDFEIFCKHAKIEISGIGRSYGKEELRLYQMKPEMGPPNITIDTFPDEDLSWQTEFDAFLQAIDGGKSDIASTVDALRALEVVRDVYRQSDSYSACNV